MENKDTTGKTDFIRREDAKEAFCVYMGFTSMRAALATNYIFNKISAADVWPVTRAHWEWDENGIDWGLGVWKCSHCHCKAETWWATKKYSPLHCAGSHFCGNCGAERR